MKRGHRSLFLLLGVALMAGSACTAKPITEKYRKEARAQDLTFSMVLQNPDAYVGEIVLWGGTILETKPFEGGTQFTVLETPLGGSERPAGTARARGRFIALSSKRMDSAIYAAGKKITLAGQVAGQKTSPLAETTYIYPVVVIKQLFLWKRRPAYPNPYSYPYDFPLGPWWGPYWQWSIPNKYGEGLD